MEIAGSNEDQFDKEQYENHLVLFVGMQRVEVETPYGEAKATECQLIIPFDDDLKPLGLYEGLVFGALGSNAYNSKAQARFGRVVKVEYDKGPGWGLEDPDDADLEAVETWAGDALEQVDGSWRMKPAENPDEAPFV